MKNAKKYRDKMKEVLVKPLSDHADTAELVFYDNGQILLRHQDDRVSSESERYIYLFTASEFEAVLNAGREIKDKKRLKCQDCKNYIEPAECKGRATVSPDSPACELIERKSFWDKFFELCR